MSLYKWKKIYQLWSQIYFTNVSGLPEDYGMILLFEIDIVFLQELDSI